MQALRGKTPLELAALAMGEESTLRCRARHEPCPGETKKLLKEMVKFTESRDFNRKVERW